MRSAVRLAFVLLLLSLLLPVVDARAQEPYVNAFYGAVNDLSSDGLRAVGSKAGPHLSFAGYWDGTGSFFPLFDPEPERFTAASAVDADGSTIAGDDDSSGVGARMSFQWNAADGIVPLAGSEVQGSRVSAMSADGSVIFGGVGGRAARWDDGVLTIPMPTGYTDGIPGTLLGQLSDGTMLGSVEPTLGDVPLPDQPTTFRTDGLDLQPLPAPDVGELHATGVSSGGTTAIGYFLDELGFAFPFRWKSGVAGTEFAILTGLGVDAHPQDVDADGDVVVGDYQETAQQRAAFVWTPSGGLRSLRAMLEAAALDTTGMGLVSACCVSDDGRIVAGGGFVARLPEPVPEPGAIARIGAAWLVLLGCAQRGFARTSPVSGAGTS